MSKPYIQLKKPFMLETRIPIGGRFAPTFTHLPFEDEADAQAFALKVWKEVEAKLATGGWVRGVALFHLNENKYIAWYPQP